MERLDASTAAAQRPEQRVQKSRELYELISRAEVNESRAVLAAEEVAVAEEGTLCSLPKRIDSARIVDAVVVVDCEILWGSVGASLLGAERDAEHGKGGAAVESMLRSSPPGGDVSRSDHDAGLRPGSSRTASTTVSFSALSALALLNRSLMRRASRSNAHACSGWSSWRCRRMEGAA